VSGLGDGGVNAEAAQCIFKPRAVHVKLLVDICGDGVTLFEKIYRRLFVRAVIVLGFDLACDGSGLRRNLGRGHFLRRIHDLGSFGSAAAAELNAGERFRLLDAYRLDIGGVVDFDLGFFILFARFFGLCLLGLLFEGRLVIKRNIYRSTLCIFDAAQLLLILNRLLFCRLFGLRLRLVLGMLPVSCPLDDLAYRDAEGVERKEHERDHENYRSAVEAERLLEGKCQQTTENAAAGHCLSAGIKPAEYRAHAL